MTSTQKQEAIQLRPSAQHEKKSLPGSATLAAPEPRQPAAPSLTGPDVPHNDLPVGNIGISAGSDSIVIMKDSRVSGFGTGVQAGQHSATDVEHSSIEAAPHPSSEPPAPSGSSGPPLFTLNGPGLISGISFVDPGIDLPQNPVPVGKSGSTVPLDEQKRIIGDLARQWKQEHDGALVRKRAFSWINEQLEKQGRDFRVEVPTNCPSAPNAPAAAIYVRPGANAQLDQDQIKGFKNGVVAGHNAATSINGTAITTDCD